jgi:ABC-type lipoprotein release transport system permease subunit
MTVIGNAFALSYGYIVMQRWLETYSNHIALSVWPFILVCCMTAGIVIFAVFLQVKKTASTNPAETIKTE